MDRGKEGGPTRAASPGSQCNTAMDPAVVIGTLTMAGHSKTGWNGIQASADKTGSVHSYEIGAAAGGMAVAVAVLIAVAVHPKALCVLSVVVADAIHDGASSSLQPPPHLELPLLGLVQLLVIDVTRVLPDAFSVLEVKVVDGVVAAVPACAPGLGKGRLQAFLCYPQQLTIPLEVHAEVLRILCDEERKTKRRTV